MGKLGNWRESHFFSNPGPPPTDNRQFGWRPSSTTRSLEEQAVRRDAYAPPQSLRRVRSFRQGPSRSRREIALNCLASKGFLCPGSSDRFSRGRRVRGLTDGWEGPGLAILP